MGNSPRTVARNFQGWEFSGIFSLAVGILHLKKGYSGGPDRHPETCIFVIFNY